MLKQFAKHNVSENAILHNGVERPERLNTNLMHVIVHILHIIFV